MSGEWVSSIISQFSQSHPDPRAAMMEVKHAGFARCIFKIAGKQVIAEHAIGIAAACFISFRPAAKLGAPVGDFPEVDPLALAKLPIFKSCKPVDAPQSREIRAQFARVLSLTKLALYFLDVAFVKSTREFDC